MLCSVKTGITIKTILKKKKKKKTHPQISTLYSLPCSLNTLLIITLECRKTIIFQNSSHAVKYGVFLIVWCKP